MCESETSSEDEVSIRNLREAADVKLFNESLYDSKTLSWKLSDNNSQTLPENQKSLRTSMKTHEEFENFGVTQSFKDFIAKKLSEVLERNVQEEDNLADRRLSKINNKKSLKMNSGIKLLSSSKSVLHVEEIIDNTADINNKNKKRKKHNIDKNNEIIKIKEAVISPERLLSKTDTQLWVNRKIGKEFKYKKLKNGTLVEQT